MRTCGPSRRSNVQRLFECPRANVRSSSDLVRYCAGVMATDHVTRVERAFAFLDISGFTKYTDREGDAAAVTQLATFRTIVRDVASSFGVRIDKWLGDGVMCVGVETTPLIEAVIEICVQLEKSDFPLPLRAGMAGGQVILFEAEDYIGTPVNMASRLCNDAAPGQILVTADIADHAPNHIDRVEMGATHLRGLAEPVPIVCLSPVGGKVGA